MQRSRSLGTAPERGSGYKPAPPAVAVPDWVGSVVQRSHSLDTLSGLDSRHESAPPGVAVLEWAESAVLH